MAACCGSPKLGRRALRAFTAPPLTCRLPGRQQRGAALLVRANWGAPVEFAAGRVLENEREAEQLQRLKVHIGGAASAYTKAGQFIQASKGGKALGAWASM